MRHRPSAPGRRLRIDPIACTGHGLCADLLPEHISLDEWGYPLLRHGRTSGPVDDDALPLAREAVSACPTLALRLEPAPPEQALPRPHRTSAEPARNPAEAS